MSWIDIGTDRIDRIENNLVLGSGFWFRHGVMIPVFIILSSSCSSVYYILVILTYDIAYR